MTEKSELCKEVELQLPSGCAITSSNDNQVDFTVNDYTALLEIKMVQGTQLKRLYASVQADGKFVDAGSFPEPEKNTAKAVRIMLEQITDVVDSIKRKKASA